jgi:hypothetical protein
MTSLQTDDRTEREDEYEGSAERELSERAEHIDDLLDTLLMDVERLGRRLLSQRVIEHELAGFDNEFGFQPARRASDEEVLAQMRADVRGAFTAWLTKDLKERLEQ